MHHNSQHTVTTWCFLVINNMAHKKFARHTKMTRSGPGQMTGICAQTFAIYRALCGCQCEPDRKKEIERANALYAPIVGLTERELDYGSGRRNGRTNGSIKCVRLRCCGCRRLIDKTLIESIHVGRRCVCILLSELFHFSERAVRGGNPISMMNYVIMCFAVGR